MQKNTQKTSNNVHLLVCISVLCGAFFFAWFGIQPAVAADVILVQGTVYLPDVVTGAEGVTVSLQNQSGYSVNRTTDSNGHFTFSDDAANYTDGSYAINLTGIAGYMVPDGLPTSFSYAAGQSTVTENFTLITAPKSINVTIRDSAGDIVTDQDAAVNAAILNAGMVRATTVRNSDSTFTLYLTGGTWLVTADVGLSTFGITSPNWVTQGESQKFTFADDESTETATAEFTVLDSTSYVEVPFLDVDGEPFTSGNRLDVVYTGITKDYGILSTKRKIDTSGVGSLFLYPGVWSFSVSRDTMPSGQSLPPEQETFVVPEGGSTTTLDPIQFVTNVGSIHGTAYMVTYDESGVATDAPAGNKTITFTNLSTGETFTQTSFSDGTFNLPEAGLGQYSVTLDAPGVYSLLSANATVTIDQPIVNGLEIKGTDIDTQMSGTVQLNGVDVENVPGVVVLEGNGERFTAAVGSDGSFSLNAYSAAFGDVVPKIYLATEPGAQVYTADKLEVSQVGQLEHIELNLQVGDSEATISGQLQNQAGVDLTSDDIGENSQMIAVNLATGSVEQTTIQSDGSYSMTVAPGTWTVMPKLEKGIDEVIVPPASGEEVSVSAGETNAEVNVDALSAKATMTGTVKDPDGTPIPEAPVIITNLPALQEEATALGTTLDPSKIITISTATDSDGQFSQPVPRNSDLSVYFGSIPTTSDFTEPQAQEVQVGTDDVSIGSVKYRNAEATLSGTLPDGIREGSVSVYSPTDGGTQSVTVNEDGTYTLPVTPGDWKVAVSGVQDGEVYLDKENIIITAGENTLDPSLDPTGVMVPGAVTTTGDVSETLVVSNSAGASVTLQPYAAGFEGDVDLTMSPDPSVLFVNGIAQIGLAYDVTAVDENGFAISQLNVPATITLPVDENAVTNEDLKLIPSYYQPAVESFLFDVSGDENGSKMVMSSSHFSRFSMVTVGNNSAEKPAAPRKTSVSKLKIASALLHWKAPKNSIVKNYTVQMRERGMKNQNHWTTYTKISDLQKKVKNLVTGTTYQFRVMAKNTQGHSKYTKWKSFTTK